MHLVTAQSIAKTLLRRDGSVQAGVVVVSGGSAGMGPRATSKANGHTAQSYYEAHHIRPCTAEAEEASLRAVGGGSRGTAAGNHTGPPPPQSSGRNQ